MKLIFLLLGLSNVSYAGDCTTIANYFGRYAAEAKVFADYLEVCGSEDAAKCEAAVKCAAGNYPPYQDEIAAFHNTCVDPVSIKNYNEGYSEGLILVGEKLSGECKPREDTAVNKLSNAR